MIKTLGWGRGHIFLALVGFFAALSFTTVHPVLPLYVESLGASYEEVGLLFSAYALTWTILQIYTGYLADRLGRKRVALIGFALYAAFAFLNYAALSFAQLLSFRVLQGVGLGLLGPSLLGLTAGFEEKGRSFAVYRAASGVGGILGPIAGGALGEYSLRVPFLLNGLFALLAAATVLGLEEGKVTRAEGRFFGSIAGLLRNRAFFLICAAAFLAELGYAAFDIAIPLTGRALNLSPTQIGVVLSAYQVSFALLQVPIGMYADKVGRKRLLIIAAFLSALFFVGLFAAPGFWLLTLLMTLLGITLGAVFVQATAMAAEVVAAETQAMSLAFFDALIDLSFTVMPLVVGFVAVYGASAPFLVCALFLTGAGILFSSSQTGIRRQDGAPLERRT